MKYYQLSHSTVSEEVLGQEEEARGVIKNGISIINQKIEDLKMRFYS